MKRKKWFSRFAFFAAAAGLVLTQAGLPVYASQITDSISSEGFDENILNEWNEENSLTKQSATSDGLYFDFIIACTSEGEILNQLPAIVSNTNGLVLAYFKSAIVDEDADGYLLWSGANNAYYQISASDYLDSADLLICEVVYDSGDNLSFQDSALAYQNEEVTIFGCVGDEDVQTVYATLLDMDEEGFMTTSDMLDSSVTYPGMVVDSAGNVVGVAISESQVWSPTTQDSFYANAVDSGSSSSESEGGTDDGTDDSANDGTDDGAATVAGEDTADDADATDLDDDDDDDGHFWANLGKTALVKIVAAIIVGCAVGLITALAIRIKKRRDAMTDSEGNGGNTVDTFADRTVPANGGNNGYMKTESYPPFSTESRGGGTQPVSIKVYAVGGYMDGRVYEVDGSEITFGRDTSNTIIFPADMKGISRRHCKVFFQDGMLMLMDCGSTYGTILEGYGKLTPHQPKALQIGVPFYLADKNNCFVIK